MFPLSNSSSSISPFDWRRPLSNIPCTSMAEWNPIFPHQNMHVIFTDNMDKQLWVANGQEALILSVPNRTIILCLPQGQRVFVYPVTAIVDDLPVTYYPFTLAYVQTITKSQGQNIKHLVLWLDSPIVPAGMRSWGAVANPQKGSTLHSATNPRQSASSGQTVIFLGRPDIGNRSVSLSLIHLSFFHSFYTCLHGILRSLLQVSFFFQLPASHSSNLPPIVYSSFLSLF